MPEALFHKVIEFKPASQRGDSSKFLFLRILQNFQEHLFLETLRAAASKSCIKDVTALKVSVFGVFLVCIFPHWD